MKKRKISPLYIIISFTLFSALAVFYIKNIITVNNLTRETNEFNIKFEKEEVENTKLKAEINRLSERDRIVSLAKEKLNMILLTDPIIVLKD